MNIYISPRYAIAAAGYDKDNDDNDDNYSGFYLQRQSSHQDKQS